MKAGTTFAIVSVLFFGCALIAYGGDGGGYTPPAPSCQDFGQIGTYPNCTDPQSCEQLGMVGTYPDCQYPPPPPSCYDTPGMTGTYPDCRPLTCSDLGQVGTYPSCRAPVCSDYGMVGMAGYSGSNTVYCVVPPAAYPPPAPGAGFARLPYNYEHSFLTTASPVHSASVSGAALENLNPAAFCADTAAAVSGGANTWCVISYDYVASGGGCGSPGPEDDYLCDLYVDGQQRIEPMPPNELIITLDTVTAEIFNTTPDPYKFVMFTTWYDIYNFNPDQWRCGVGWFDPGWVWDSGLGDYRRASLGSPCNIFPFNLPTTGYYSGPTQYGCDFQGFNYPVRSCELYQQNASNLPDLTVGAISPTTATRGSAATLSATVLNQGVLSTGASSNNSIWIDNDTEHAAVAASSATNPTGVLAPSSSSVISYSYTFPAAGTWYVRLCADNTTGWVGSILESNEDNNCGPWTAITVADIPALPACSDSLDNDGDGFIDLADSGCGGDPLNTTESPQCNDGVDNDGNTLLDAADPGCSNGSDNNESGYTVVPGAPLLTLTPSRSPTRYDSTVILMWGGQNIVADSCTLEGDNGDSWNLAGTAGSKTTSSLTSQATYTLSCTGSDGFPVSREIVVKVTPRFQEI